ncbi:MAG: hypothetical protein OEQ29_12960 [Alphaproteobacteria bacterium]|nr:hypothetical protein [Alphaproteobacteria bacterium]
MSNRILTASLNAAAGIAAIVAASLPGSAAANTYKRCYDPQGRPVAVLASTKVKMGNVAVAGRTKDGRPFIAYNPEALKRFHPLTRIYIYYHECAHHRLGHSSGFRPQNRENAADCFAIRYMTRRGMLNRARMRIIMRDVRRFGGGDHVHLPGAQRAQLLAKCYRYALMRMARLGGGDQRPDGFSAYAATLPKGFAG